jgi:site-specific DNA-adenine methylase
VRLVATKATARATERQTRDVDARSLSAIPPLKWAGGKRWLLPHIQPIWHANQNRRYVEPFCGGLAVALGLQPERALLNDINQYQKINYASDFHAYQELFRRWKFANKDLAKLSIEPDDFIYAVAPYDVEFTTYSAGGFSWDDQVRTAELLAKHRGPVLLSNQATKRIVDLYTELGFDLRFFASPRRISCNGNRAAAREALASRNV